MSADFPAMQLGDGIRRYRVVRDGLPRDARVVGAFLDRDQVVLVLRSAEFEPVESNVSYPEIVPILQTIKPTRDDQTQAQNRPSRAPGWRRLPGS